MVVQYSGVVLIHETFGFYFNQSWLGKFGNNESSVVCTGHFWIEICEVEVRAK